MNAFEMQELSNIRDRLSDLLCELDRLRDGMKGARLLIHGAADLGDVAAKTWLATYPEE